VDISITGTTIGFRPGFIAGSPPAAIRSHQHDCPSSKPIGYFLEPLLVLAAFGKAPINVLLTGLTGGLDGEPSVDLLRVGLLPVLKRFGIEDYELRVDRHAASSSLTALVDIAARFCTLGRWAGPLYIPR